MSWRTPLYSPAPRLIELGAGDGRLCRKVVAWFPTARVTALDLAPRPRDLPEGIAWRQGDLLDNLPHCEGEFSLRRDDLASFSGRPACSISAKLHPAIGCSVFASLGVLDSRTCWAC